MTLLAVLFSYIVILAVISPGSAGPACARKNWQKQSCIERCQGKWGYPGMMMGTGPWGVVIQKAAEDSWDSKIAQACGVSTSSVPSATAAGALGNNSTPASSSSVLTTTSSSSVPQITPSSSSQFSSASFSVQSISTDKVQSSSSILPSISSVAPSTSTSTPQTTTQATSTSSSSSPDFTPATTSPTEQPSPSTSSSTPAPVTTTANSDSSSSSTSSTSSDSSGLSGSSDSSGTTSDSDIQAYLSAHNSVRAQHGASPLTWSDEAASKAQQWANNCKFVHSGGSLGPFGENLAAGTGDSYGIPQAIKSWTDEVSQYDPNNPQASHFTQVVWKGTTQVGCAVQSCSGIFDASFGLAKFYVCEYSPQGNIIGQFAENVQV